MINNVLLNRIRLSLLLAVLLCTAMPVQSYADDLRIYAAAGVKVPLMEMAIEFEKNMDRR